MRAMSMAQRQFGDLRVVLTGGSDGKGGGNGPLVVLLHGFGAPGTDLIPLCEVLAVPPGTRFAFPSAPLSLSPGGDFGLEGFGMMDSRAWWMIDMQNIERLMSAVRRGDIESAVSEVPEGLAAARDKLIAALDEMERELAVPPGQMVLGGFSQGAMLSLDVALRTERKLAGLLLMSGTLLCKNEWLKLMPAKKGLKVVQSHGRQDMLLPFAIAEKLRDHLKDAGLDVEFVPFSGGHEIPQPVLKAGSVFLLRALSDKPL